MKGEPGRRDTELGSIEFADAAVACERPAAIPPGPRLAAFLADNESLDRLDDAELIEMMAASRRQTA